MYGGQVTVGVCEGWIDLNGAGVALQSSLDVLHLFQRVPHVGIGVGKGGTDPENDRKETIRRTLVNTHQGGSSDHICPAR